MSALREMAIISAGCIVAIWLVYPLLIAALATSKRRRACTLSPRRQPSSQPTVSVIIATCDDAATVRERIVDCLRAAPHSAPLEVIVALDVRGARATVDELSPPPRVKVVRGDQPGGKASALNAAVRAARGELLVFTDAHQRFQPGAIGRLVAAFADEHVGAASGRLELAPAAQRSLVGRYWSYERWLRRGEALLHSCVGATGAIWALRRSLWTPLPAHLILDDVYAPMRVVLSGHRVAFVDEARAVDTRRIDRSQEFRRKVRTLTGVLQLCMWLPALLVPTRNPIWLQFVCHKVLRLLTPYWLLAVVASVTALGVHWMKAQPATTAIPILATAAMSITAKARVLRIARESLIWGFMLQAAVVMAAMNGVRRRWDVWRPQ